MPRHLAIVGSTASGKSAFAAKIARQRSDVEIISLDSMQVYRGFDIGTAKPTREERSAIRHHLIDVADPEELWSVRATQHLAMEALTEIESRGGHAIFVGGTGLYVQAVVDQFEIPPEDPNVRSRLEAALGTPVALAEGYQRLQALDPDAAHHMEPTNARRIVRALEVIELTGAPFSQFGGGVQRYGTPAIDVELIGIDVGDALESQITARLDVMLDMGWLQEVEQLHPPTWGATAAAAIGYRELAAVLRQELTMDAARSAIALRTLQFAKRQRRWFRRDPRVKWLEAEKLCQTAEEILASWK